MIAFPLLVVKNYLLHMIVDCLVMKKQKCYHKIVKLEAKLVSSFFNNVLYLVSTCYTVLGPTFCTYSVLAYFSFLSLVLSAMPPKLLGSREEFF
jgi:hypothetical protein